MESKIPSIVEKEFQARVIEITKITDGYSHFMYLVKIDKAPFEIIIRFLNSKKKEYNLEKEKYIIETLKKVNLPVPRIYAFNNSEEGYMIIEKFKGERLDKLWSNLNSEEKKKLTEKIGMLMARLHSIELPEFGKIEAEGKIISDIPFSFKKSSNNSELKETLEYNKALREILIGFSKDMMRLLSYNNVNKELILSLFNHITRNLDKIRYEGNPRLIHGDFQKGHLFVEKVDNEYEITGIIDFEFAESLPPEYDFIKLHREGFFEDRELKLALDRGYGREISKEAVELYRLMRDLQFSLVLLDSGDKITAEKVLTSIEERLSSKF